MNNSKFTAFLAVIGAIVCAAGLSAMAEKVASFFGIENNIVVFAAFVTALVITIVDISSDLAMLWRQGQKRED